MVLTRRQNIKSINIADFIRFPAFLGLQSFIYKFVLCLLRRLLAGKNGLNSFLAGFISGLAVLVLND